MAPRLTLFLGVSLGLLSAGAVMAHTQGLYRTQVEAARRAVELKCEGTFRQGDRWMPCANEQALHAALSRQ